MYTYEEGKKEESDMICHYQKTEVNKLVAARNLNRIFPYQFVARSTEDSKK